MSLIQAALDKTHHKITSPPEKKLDEPKLKPLAPALKGLDVLDYEVEKKISEIQQKPSVSISSQKQASQKSIVLLLLLGVFLLAGIVYWTQNRVETEAVPPLVVDIERRPATKYQSPVIQNKSRNVFQSTAFDFQSRFQLTGLVWDVTNPMALINGRIVKTGDWLDKTVIVKGVGRDSATLDHSGETFVLKLKT